MYRISRSTGNAYFGTCHETLDDALLLYDRTYLCCQHITLQEDGKGIIKEHKKIWQNGKYEVIQIR